MIISPDIHRPIRLLHLEPTDVCQAACPGCERETNTLFDKSQKNHLTISQILNHFDVRHIANLKKVLMCGTYGDPAAGRHTMEIYRYFRDINPGITLGMNTNGALQSTKWWRDLGKLFCHIEDYAVFSIDGLDDTNHIYRIGVDWKKLMKNIEAYVNAGGRAHWDMLVWRHNEHQIEACERLARELGFYWFRVKVSKRALPAGFASPVNWQRSAMISSDIKCQALDEDGAFIDAKGQLYPCCWIGIEQRKPVDFITIQQTWSTDNPHPVCARTCGQKNAVTGFTGQWQKEIELRI